MRAMDLLSGSQVAQWADTALLTLQEAQLRLNAANVFPVADSDTGTNLVLTLQQGQHQVAALGPEASGAEAMQAFALGALMGARGNSGIIISEYLRGFSVQLRAGQDLVQCLTGAAQSAFSAVADPVSGTMLTAAQEAATAAQRAQQEQASGADAVPGLGTAEHSNSTAKPIMLAACAGARSALARSPEQLDVLQKQGVLDAGAYGLTMVVDALARVLIDSAALTIDPGAADLPELPDLTFDPGTEHHSEPAVEQPEGASACGHSHGDGEFEVMFLVEHHQDPKAGLLERLQRIGYSVVVVGGDGVWQVHVHTDDPAAALACVEDGQARQICIRHLNDRSDEAPVLRAPGIVAAVSSPGLIPDMARAGAVVLMRGAAGWRTGEVARAVVDAGTDRVVVLTREADVDAVQGLTDSAATSGISIDVVMAPTDLHAVVALTAAAELLDAVPSSAGIPARAGRKLVSAMAQAISRLGETLSLDLAADALPADLQQQLGALTTDGGLGLTMVLYGTAVPADALQHMSAMLTAEPAKSELVLLPSGVADARAQIGTL